MWRDWPRKSLLLAELIEDKFPRRFARGHRERHEETERLRAEENARVFEARSQRTSILASEAKIALAAVVFLLLLWFKSQYGQYYHHYD